ncbi:hypothetical protein THIX_10536 [Thiomonas sp. X19]|nr:hypothetical protein THIX_10536 [Thiomonas sp. X19]
MTTHPAGANLVMDADFPLNRTAFGLGTGSYTFDPKSRRADKADITIPVDGLDTFFPMRDQDLKGAAFFDAKANPAIHFVSTEYVPQSKIAAGSKARARCPICPSPGAAISPASSPPQPSIAWTSA